MQLVGKLIVRFGSVRFKIAVLFAAAWAMDVIGSHAQATSYRRTARMARQLYQRKIIS